MFNIEYLKALGASIVTTIEDTLTAIFNRDGRKDEWVV